MKLNSLGAADSFLKEFDQAQLADSGDTNVVSQVPAAGQEMPTRELSASDAFLNSFDQEQQVEPSMPDAPMAQAQPKVTQEEGQASSPFVQGAKQIGAMGARGLGKYLSGIVGIPGNFQSMVDELGLWAAGKMTTGEKAPQEGETSREYYKRIAPEMKQGPAPITSEDFERAVIRPAIKALFGEGYEKPEGNYEASADEAIADFGFIMTPMLGGAGWKTALKVAGIPNLAKLFSKELGASPLKQEAVKFGTLGAINLSQFIRPGTYRKRMNELYEQRNELAKGVETSYKEAYPLIKLKDDFKDAGLAKEITKNVERIETMFPTRKSKIPVDELTKLEHHINKIYKKPNVDRDILMKFNEPIKDAVRASGKGSPEFVRAYDSSRELFKAIKSSDKISNFVNNTASGKAIAGVLAGGGALGLGSLMLLGGTGHIRKYAPKLALGGTILGATFMAAMSKNPEARKVMGELAKAMFNEEKGLALNLAAKLSSDLQDQDQSQ